MANSSNSISLFPLIYPSYLGLWPEDRDAPGFFSSFPGFFSFSSQACLRGDPSLCPKRTLHPYSCFCLLAAAILNHSGAAVHSVHCLAAAVSPFGTNSRSSSSSSEPTGMPLPHHPVLLWQPRMAPVTVNSSILALIVLSAPLSKRSPALVLPPPISPPKCLVITIV